MSTACGIPRWSPIQLLTRHKIKYDSLKSKNFSWVKNLSTYALGYRMETQRGHLVITALMKSALEDAAPVKTSERTSAASLHASRHGATTKTKYHVLQ